MSLLGYVVIKILAIIVWAISFLISSMFYFGGDTLSGLLIFVIGIVIGLFLWDKAKRPKK